MERSISQFFTKIYGWMGVALIASGALAFLIESLQSIQLGISLHRWIIVIVIITLIMCVILLSARIDQFSPLQANALLLIYAGGFGVIFSLLFVAYEIAALSTAFFVAAGMFIVMSLFGTIAAMELFRIKSVFLMALFGIIISLCVNIFLDGTSVDLLISIITVLIFSLLTAYEIPKFIKYHLSISHKQKKSVDVALTGALRLYLDLINMFICVVYKYDPK